MLQERWAVLPAWTNSNGKKGCIPSWQPPLLLLGADPPLHATILAADLGLQDVASGKDTVLIQLQCRDPSCSPSWQGPAVDAGDGCESWPGVH